MLSYGDEEFWDLKESAKWSLDVRERKRAIMQLANSYGLKAVQPITEIKEVAAYDELRKACIEAIKIASKGRSASALRPIRRKRKAKNRAKAAKSKRRNSQ